jgi:alpha-N-arabinofuranosidase
MESMVPLGVVFLWGMVLTLAVPVPGRECLAQVPEATVRVDCGSPGESVNERLLGQNLPVSISGLWDSSLDQINVAGESSVMKIRPSVLRFPAGSFSDIYFWEDGLSLRTAKAVSPNDSTVFLTTESQWKSGKRARFLGPSAGRYGAYFDFLSVDRNVIGGVEGIERPHPAGTPVRLDYRNGQPDWFNNALGSIEIIKLSEIFGSELLLTVNFGTGRDSSGNLSTMASMDQRIMRAAAWVAFMNGSVSDARPIGIDPEGNDWKTVGYWARKRVEEGRTEPVSVVYWEVGNELFWASEVGHTTAREYAVGFGRFAKAMKAVDPAIKVGAAGMSDPSGRGDPDPHTIWNATLLQIAKGDMDFLAVHPYYPSALSSQVLFGSETWYRAVMAGASHAMVHMRRIRGLIEQTEPRGKKVEIVVSEYGIWPADSKDARDFSNLARAVYDADLLLHLLRAGEGLGVTMAAGWNLQSSTETALIRHDWATGLGTLRPQYHSFQMLRDLSGARFLPVSVAGPTFDSPKVGNMEALRKLPVLNAVALIGEDERMKLLVVNRHLSKTVQATIHLRDYQPREGCSARVLAGPTPSAHNEDNPSSVQPATLPVDCSSQPMVHAFPPHSFTVLELNGIGNGG